MKDKKKVKVLKNIRKNTTATIILALLLVVVATFGIIKLSGGLGDGEFDIDVNSNCNYISPYKRDIVSHHRIVGLDGEAHRAGLWLLYENSATSGLKTAAYCAQYGRDLSANTIYCKTEIEDVNDYNYNAAKLRAILVSSFPYVSVNEMKASIVKSLKSSGLDYEWAENLSGQEIMAGVQAAVWHYTMGVTVTSANHEVSYLDTVVNLSGWNDSSYSQSIYADKCQNCSTYVKNDDEGVKTRIEKLRDYLVDLKGITKEEIPSGKLAELLDKDVQYNNGTYTYTLKFGFSNASDAKDFEIIFYDNSNKTGEPITADSTDIDASGNKIYKITRTSSDSIYAAITQTATNVHAYFYYAKSGIYQSMVNVNTSTDREETLIEVSSDRGSLSISKLNASDNTALKGATLVLKNSSGTEIARWVTDGTPKVIHNLQNGTYTLEEVSAPENCIKSLEKVTIKLSQSGTTTSATMKNTCPDVVKISKRTLTGTDELPGATLVLKDSKGNIIKQWVSTTEPTVIKGLEPGIYTLTETTAPEYCLLSEETITITVTNKGSVVESIMKNTCPDKFLISKRLISGGDELPGAKMQITSSDGTIVDEWISTSEPHLFGGFKAGEYILTETTAPDDCKLSSEQIKFEVTNDGIQKEVEMLNSCVPNTGLNTDTIYYIIGGVFAVAGIVIIVLYSRKKYKKS